MNLLEWLSKIFEVPRWFDKMALKWAEMRNAQKELEKVTQSREEIKHLLFEEVKEKNKYKEQLEKEKVENRVATAKYTEYLVGWVIDNTYKRIEERYTLVPKNPLSSALAKRPLGNTNLLGQTLSLLPESKNSANSGEIPGTQ